MDDGSVRMGSGDDESEYESEDDGTNKNGGKSNGKVSFKPPHLQKNAELAKNQA